MQKLAGFLGAGILKTVFSEKEARGRWDGKRKSRLSCLIHKFDYQWHCKWAEDCKSGNFERRRQGRNVNSFKPIWMVESRRGFLLAGFLKVQNKDSSLQDWFLWNCRCGNIGNETAVFSEVRKLVVTQVVTFG